MSTKDKVKHVIVALERITLREICEIQDKTMNEKSISLGLQYMYNALNCYLNCDESEEV